MRRKSLVLLCAGLILTLGAGFAFPRVASAHSAIYVDASWTSTSCGGHEWGVDATNTIQDAIDLADTGATITVYPGTYTEVGQIVIDKNLSIVGDSSGAPVIKPAADTGSSGDTRGWWLVQAGVTFNLTNVELDGSGRQIYQAIRSYGSGSIDDCYIHDITYPGYAGVGVVIMGNPVTVQDSRLERIGRIGVFAFGAGVTNATITGNEYHGKGSGDWLDYGVEVGGGATATVAFNNISGCTGVASSDGSTSAGVLVTTYYGLGTRATVSFNTFGSSTFGACTAGIAVGYDNADTSAVTARGNDFSQCVWGIDSTAPQVDAVNNRWGSASGPTHASNTYNVDSQGVAVSDHVTFVPWDDGTGHSVSPVTTTSPEGSYASIQAAVDASDAGGTVNVAAGTYTEQVVINKNLTLAGSGNPVITAPATVAPFKYPESSATWEPVVIAFGGAADSSGNISGTGTVAANISRITVDGNERTPTSGCRSAGILLRNVHGTIDGNAVRQMYIDGAQTFGICAAGASDVTISHNDVSGWSRGGIGVIGDFGTNGSGPLPDPHAVVTGNTVSGPGMGVPVTWAPNGIQFGYGAAGKATYNTVTGCGYPGSDWSGSGIIVACADDIVVENNTINANQTGISVCGWMWQADGAIANGNVIRGNTVTANDYGISVQNKSNNTSILGNTITGSRYDGIDVCNFGSEYYCYGPAPTNTTIHNNIIAGNNTAGEDGCAGLWVDTGVATVDATNNWWGHASGPHHDGDDPTGQGDWIIGDANHDPYDPGTLSFNVPSRAQVERTLTLSAILSLHDGTPIAYPLEYTFTASLGDVSSPQSSDTGDVETTWYTGGVPDEATLTVSAVGLTSTATCLLSDPLAGPPEPSGTTAEFTEESEDGVVTVLVPGDVCPDPVALAITASDDPPDTGGNPNLGVFDITLTVVPGGTEVHDLLRQVTITFHYTAASLAAAGITDPHDLRIWYWDTDATPPCWIALPAVVDEAAGTISTTVDHLTTFTAMVDADFPALPDAAGTWAEASILRLASLGAVGGFEDGTFRPELAVTRAQFAKFVVKSLGIAEAASLPAGINDAASVQAWAVPFVGACLRDGILTGSNGYVRPNDTITRAEAAAMIIRALKLGLDTTGTLAFGDAANVPGWAAPYVSEVVAHGIINGLPGNVFDPSGKLTRAQAVTILAKALDLEE